MTNQKPVSLKQAQANEILQNTHLKWVAFYMIVPLGIAMYLGTIAVFWLDLGSCWSQWGLCGVDGLIGWGFKTIISHLYPTTA